ncbi:MAG: ComF family protein [Flavobacteriaceae bacterium]
MKGLHNLFNLFYPPICICCDTKLLDQESHICLECRMDLPFVDNLNYQSNPLTEIFEGRVSIENGGAFLYYTQLGKVKKIIHELKYKGNQMIGVFFGHWFGQQLLESKHFSTIDYIIPVPLHSKKLRQRGYNQLTKFGEILETILSTTYSEEILQRVSSAKTQTFKKRLERFNNQDSKFVVNDLTILENKHILLIDDVVTTGATLEACCLELEKVKNLKISIITMALTQ